MKEGNEALLKRDEEIADESSCWSGLENEIIKLYSLFSKCCTKKHEGQEWVNINYVREKIFNLLIQHPTILSADARRLYISMRWLLQWLKAYLNKKKNKSIATGIENHQFLYMTSWSYIEIGDFLYMLDRKSPKKEDEGEHEQEMG